MTLDDMNALLIGLPEQPVWEAMLQYWEMRDKLVFDALASVDPFKNPTEVARNQGIRMGLYDLKEAIELLRKNRDEAETMVEEPVPVIPRRKK